MEYKDKEYTSSEMEKLKNLYEAVEDLRFSEIAQELSLCIEEIFLSVDECINELIKRSQANEDAWDDNL